MAAQYYEKNTSGMNVDRFMGKFDESTLVNVQRHYWTAKQFIRSKLGKKEDEHLEASDLELDSCLNMYRSVQSTSTQLLACVDNYCNLIYDEAVVQNVLGKYVKERGKKEKGENTGRSLIAVGRALMFASHQLNGARIPLSTFFNKLSVFVERAIGDCAQTVEAVELARTEYRGSLLWMKKTSEELDPEQEGTMEKFREAQATVRCNKDRLDKLKVDTLQKVDLLSASRSNLLSYVLTHYQYSLQNYYQRTAKAYTALAENISSYNDYEFEVLSHLFTGVKTKTTEGETSKKEKPSDAEESVGRLISVENQDVEQLLFGRDSPLFVLNDEETDERNLDSPLCEQLENEPEEEPEADAPKTPLAIGPLETIFKSNDPIPALNPPPASSLQKVNPGPSRAGNADLLSWFPSDIQKPQSPQKNVDWTAFLEGFETQNRGSSL